MAAMIDEQPAHRLCPDGEHVGAPLPLRVTLVLQPHPRFVHERRALERYAQGSRGASPAKASRACDLTVYEMELDTDEGPIRLEFDEANVPKDLAALVEKLAKRAKPIPP